MEIEDIVKAVVKEINKLEKGSNEKTKISVGISNHHIHLSKEDFKKLFGEDAELTNIKDLTQPGQFSCKECVTIIGPKGVIEKLRIVGPFRAKSQVEILTSDTYKLGICCPLRESGKIENTPGIIVAGAEGCIKLQEGVIIAKRHIHMTLIDAKKFNLNDGDIVDVEFQGPRGGSLSNVVVRISEKCKLDFHIDIDEANGLGIKDGDYVILKYKIEK